MTFKLMTSQVVQRARPLITYICVLGIQRVDRHTSGSLGEQEMLWEHEATGECFPSFLRVLLNFMFSTCFLFLFENSTPPPPKKREQLVYFDDHQ